jgi:hypothetical protein
MSWYTLIYHITVIENNVTLAFLRHNTFLIPSLTSFCRTFLPLLKLCLVKVHNFYKPINFFLRISIQQAVNFLSTASHDVIHQRCPWKAIVSSIYLQPVKVLSNSSKSHTLSSFLSLLSYYCLMKTIIRPVTWNTTLHSISLLVPYMFCFSLQCWHYYTVKSVFTQYYVHDPVKILCMLHDWGELN